MTNYTRPDSLLTGLFDRYNFRIYNAARMVNDNKKNEVDIEITNEENFIEDIELEDEEEKQEDKLKKLRDKLKACDEEKREILEELQRAKAEFLNARKRLEEERIQDRVRSKKQHIEELLPLCDSFQMAMNDKAWENADASWRKGIEGINAQLQGLLNSYGVILIEPLGKSFDPNRHEAIGTEPVTDKDKVDMVVKVMQRGYELKNGDKVEVIRAARVITGTFTE